MKKLRAQSHLQRLEFLLTALQATGKVDRAQKVLYLPFDIELNLIELHDIAQLKHIYKFRVQYEIPC